MALYRLITPIAANIKTITIKDKSKLMKSLRSIMAASKNGIV
jgi:hypothetical protein